MSDDEGGWVVRAAIAWIAAIRARAFAADNESGAIEYLGLSPAAATQALATIRALYETVRRAS